MREERKMKWQECGFAPWLFASESRAWIELLSPGDVRFQHGERVLGVLLPLLLERRRLRARFGLDVMNPALLKGRAERAWASRASTVSLNA